MPIGLEQWRMQIGALEAQRYRYLSRASRKATRGGMVRVGRISGGCLVGIVLCVTLLCLATSLSMRLLLAGDVERNPGPLPDELLSAVDNSELAADDLRAVYKEVYALAGRWRAMYLSLGLSPSERDAIAASYPNNPHDCLQEALLRWLQKAYNFQQYGSPTWRMLVEAVADPAGGNDPALAEKIAKAHQAAVVSPPTPSSLQAAVGRPGYITTPVHQQQQLDPQETPYPGHLVSKRDKSTEDGSHASSSGLVTDKGHHSETGSTTEENQFPYLDMTGLSQEEKDTLKGRLQEESMQIMLKFQVLVNTFQESLKHRNVPIKTIADHLTYLGAFTAVKSQRPLLEDCLPDVRAAPTVDDAFWILRHYSSFFNYHVIEHIIKGLGTKDDKSNLQKYKEDLKQYSKRRCYECPSCLVQPSDVGKKLILKLDISFEPYSVEQLQIFKCRLSQILQISEGALKLCYIEKGCIQFTFQIPSFMEKEIFPLSYEQETALIDEGVLDLRCGEYEFSAEAWKSTNSTPPSMSQSSRRAAEVSMEGDERRKLLEKLKSIKRKESLTTIMEFDMSCVTGLAASGVHLETVEGHGSAVNEKANLTWRSTSGISSADSEVEEEFEKQRPSFVTIRRFLSDIGPDAIALFDNSNAGPSTKMQGHERGVSVFAPHRNETVSPPTVSMEGTDKLDGIIAETPDGSKLLIPCHNHTPVGELKEAVGKELRLHGKLPFSGSGSDTSEFILTCTIEGKEYELLCDSQLLFKTAVFEQLLKDKSIKVRPFQRLPEREIAILCRISHLTGVVMDDSVSRMSSDPEKLATIPEADQKEVQLTRRTLHDYVMEVASSRDEEDYSLSTEVVHMEIPIILSLKIPTDNKVDIIFHYIDVFFLKMRIHFHWHAERVLAEVFPCVVGCKLVEDRIDEYTLQITGEESYIHGEHELLEFKDIRRCISKQEPIHLSVVKKPPVELDRPQEFRLLTLDPHSTKPPLHADVSSKSQVHRNEVQSAWESEENFSIQVVEVDNLPLDSKLKSKQDSHVFVTLSIHHGTKELSALHRTATRSLSTSRLEWCERVDFGHQKKNIPRAAKIKLTISEYTRGKSHHSGTDKCLYWGFVTAYNHMGVLRSGKEVISLWPTKHIAMPNPSAPAASNPDPKAVIVTIIFDESEVPIYFPSTNEQSLLSFYRQQPELQNLLQILKKDKTYSKLPVYIASVNWGDVTQCLEVYSSLDQLADVTDTIPIEIALRLLDSDFPDDKVRAFATSILEKLYDEELEEFLIQLTQALKFEPHHDSALARFLLKRALRNKRIGHFFFWYLKCEMYNPLFTPRFGVILEAYLKGCGEAMLTRFKDEVEMQAILEEIGRKLKQEYNDDASKMQAALPEILEGEKFVFIPVYNPRSILGNLRASTCKILSSKKKPISLELQNVHPTALAPTPTRLILKMGDDLRQDMITLRMLSLFEKLWERKGLDLELIPYGCIATGPNTGFIEVVKNARTIAEVSGDNDSKKLLTWIKSHQLNAFGEVDPDKVMAAVNRFTHSCAGYSVATYVLGIGDRHNDNIMVTTSGNLFHVDFGHFFGNIKYYMGFKRKWAPFVLTPDFVNVMGGEGSEMFEKYKQLCCRAFLILRKNAELIINLFSMMRSTGIPELTCVEDTDYIRMALLLDIPTEHQAEKTFRSVIQKCLNLKWTVQLMWQIHLNFLKASSSS